MAGQTAIEWTDATWTPLRARNRATGAVGWHCEHVSPGCQRCYAEAFNAQRLGTRLPFKPGHRVGVEHFLDVRMLVEPLRWRRPRRIFVCSMTDLFGAWVPDALIDRVFGVMALRPQHTFQVLTKRSARMRDYCARRDERGWHPSMTNAALMAATGRWNTPALDLRAWPLPNVWLGVSAEDQARADERRSDLAALAYGGWITFVSYEPALGPIDWRGWQFLYWMISGGESGHRARIHSPFWHRATRDFAAAHGIAYLFKQWGCYAPLPAALPVAGPSELHTVAWPDGTVGPGCPTRNGGPGIQLYATTKAYAGRILDGRLHDAMPEVRP